MREVGADISAAIPKVPTGKPIQESDVVERRVRGLVAELT